MIWAHNINPQVWVIYVDEMHWIIPHKPEDDIWRALFLITRSLLKPNLHTALMGSE
jgi:hypothetical protein